MENADWYCMFLESTPTKAIFDFCGGGCNK